MRNLAVLGFTLFLFTAPLPIKAEPSESEQRILAKMPAEWLACSKTSDCRLLPYNCAEALAINTKHLSEGKELAYQIEHDPATMNCGLTPNMGAPPHYVAYCVINRCKARHSTE